MSKFKFSKLIFIISFLFTLQLGACAKEKPTPVAKQANTALEVQKPELQATQDIKADSEISTKEQIEQEEAQVILPQVPISELNKVEPTGSTRVEVQEPEISKVVTPELKVLKEAKEKIVVAEVEPVKELPASPQSQQESNSSIQTEVKSQTAAQAMLNLDQYRGKVVYLDFWASWCQPCQQTFPWMDAMQKKYPDDIVFVAVNFGENPEDTQEFLKRFPADIKFVYDPLVQIASEYNVPGLPYSFVYGRKGELLGKHAGFAGGSAENLEAALKNLFASGE